MTTLKQEIEACYQAAVGQGWDWARDEWEPTHADIVSVIEAIGRRPTREEWADAGYPRMPGQYVSGEE